MSLVCTLFIFLQLPRIFGSHDFSIYSSDIVFEDNIRGVKTSGIFAYVNNLRLLKILLYVKYSSIKVELLKITQHPEDGTVKVRWRIAGYPGYFKLLFGIFRKYRPSFRVGTVTKDITEWIDGFSIFYINSDGKICRHVCDKVSLTLS
ncbi:hypothetical protein B4U79_10331 [Dinothrombium tinctorium]|uniref:Uncharacterized protein n=1 Tax=Dinothrombium tinctorium TaxID=1965070 RepID=A0A3S3PRW7_9ACAR|nr:hypothetical protein B4U79_00877 [Dinothrombium tinctorium]RWS05525.1 hypothetical protein B4U79_14354 [Dinothrombium tinctorium]RWS05531.1 hypothetical protein B4U79_04952 [Dinothrombium tinctorium]RWS07044.1 hypothetical protein B4U79_10331 [Dinothrombium tinctorium]